MRAVASRFQYPHHLTEPVSVLFSGIDFCGNSFGYSIAPAVVVEKVVSLDKRPDEKPVAGIAKFVSQKILETKPVSADFAKSFRMVDACVDVVLEDMLVPVCYQKRIFLRELRTVGPYTGLTVQIIQFTDGEPPFIQLLRNWYFPST